MHSKFELGDGIELTLSREDGRSINSDDKGEEDEESHSGRNEE